MQPSTSGLSCQAKCWASAGVIGLAIFVLQLALGGTGVGTALFLGVLGAVLLGFLFTWLFCAPAPQSKPAEPASSDRDSGLTSAAHAAGQATGAVAAKTAQAASKAKQAVTGDDTGDAKGADTTAAKKADAPPRPAVTGNPPDENAKASTETPGADARPDVHAAPAETDAETGASVATDQAGTQPEPKAPAPKTGGGAATRATPDAAETDTPISGGAEATPEPAASQAEAPSSSAADKAPDTASGAAAGSAEAGEEEKAAEEGTKPETLTAPRGGKADNLKEIKGVGPKLETLLNEMGFYHFDQIAGWTDAEIAWVDANLKGFKGRVTRDDWVGQARILASGGETEFSKRVDDGDVY